MISLRRVLLASVLVAAIACWFGLRAWDASLNAPYHLVEDGLYIGRASKEIPPHTEAIVSLCGIEDRHQVQAMFWSPSSKAATNRLSIG